MATGPVLFLAHTETGGVLPRLSREALTGAAKLARELGAPLAVGLFGDSPEAAVNALANCGAASFHVVAGPEFAVSRYATDVLAAGALVRATGATVVVAPGTSRFSRALPGLAGRLGGAVDTHVTGIAVEGGSVQVQRWYYRQRMLATLIREARPWILLVDGGVFEGYAGAPGEAPAAAVAVEVPGTARRTRVVGEEAAAGGASTIRPDAALLFVAGAGWTKKQADGAPHVKKAEALIHDFLERSQASLGSSKSLVDQAGDEGAVISYMSHLNQVGQTGATPRHPKGLSTCCHGEEPHVVGWRFITERRAVNLDPNCGWARGKTDVLYVADAFEVVEKMNEILAGS